MKKLIMGFAACALILSSCSNNEALLNTSNPNAIGFSNLNNRLTKAANDQSADYMVYASQNGAWFTNLAGTTVNGITNAYSPFAFWPNETSGTFVDGDMTFYAYAPASSTAFDAATAFASAGSVATANYTVGTNANEDFTYVKSSPISGKPASGIVDFTFKHALSNVKLGTVVLDQSLLNEGYDINTDCQIKLMVEKNAGTFDINGTTSVWSGAASGSAASYSGSNSYYIMPQTVTAIPATGAVNTIRIQLTHVQIKKGTTVIFPVGGTTTDYGDIKIEFINPTALAAFVEGHRYTVNFKLGSDLRAPGTATDDPTSVGVRIFSDIIAFSATTTSWIDESLNYDLGFAASAPGTAAADYTTYTGKLNTYTAGLPGVQVVSGKFTIAGPFSSPLSLGNIGDLADTNFAAGSKVIIDATGATGLSTANKITVIVPTGWSATGGTGTGNNELEAAGTIVLTKN